MKFLVLDMKKLEARCESTGPWMCQIGSRCCQKSLEQFSEVMNFWWNTKDNFFIICDFQSRSNNMASFQQKLMLKGSDESIDYFTKVLKDVKDKAGYSTAEAMLKALENWIECGTPSAKCEALER